MPTMTATNETVLDDFLTPGQVCEMFNRGSQTIDSWRKDRGFPYVRIPGDDRDTIRYRLQEVTQWARAKGVAYRRPRARKR